MNVQAGLHLCCLHATKSVFLLPKPILCLSEPSVGAYPSDYIWDFRKLPFPSQLGKYFIKIWKISAKIHEIGKINVIFGSGMTSL